MKAQPEKLSESAEDLSAVRVGFVCTIESRGRPVALVRVVRRRAPNYIEVEAVDGARGYIVREWSVNGKPWKCRHDRWHTGDFLRRLRSDDAERIAYDLVHEKARHAAQHCAELLRERVPIPLELLNGLLAACDVVKAWKKSQEKPDV